MVLFPYATVPEIDASLMPPPFTQPLSHPHAGYPSDFSAGPRFNWTVRAVGDLSHVPAHIRGRAIPASVPGCIHTDLMDAGLIPDPAVGMNESEVQWVSHTDWRYELIFEADPRLLDHHELDLCFECLDTIAAIELNGYQLGTAASEFIPHRFSVLGLLNKGENRLAITFTSPLRYIHEQAKKHGPLPVNGDWDPYCYIRKCASNFQWDWGPKVATCGIAGRVTLLARSSVAMAHTRIVLSDDGDVAFHCGFAPVWYGEMLRQVQLELSVFDEHGRRIEGRTESIDFASDNSPPRYFHAPRDVWLPHTHGPRPRYRIKAVLRHDGIELDRWSGWTGLRLLTPDRVHTNQDTAFPLHLNDKPVFCRGANWIPEGLWPRDRTYARVRRRLEQAVAAGMNMIRVWGGGRYEPDWFYDICDELGLMVWQDFMFSCACYPEHEEYRQLVEAEARHQVARLSRHPSVVLWCGGNECEWAHESWGFKEKLAESGQASRGWGQLYYRDLLPKIVAELAPGTPYLPNSPYSPTVGTHPNESSEGDRHTWDLVGDDFRKHIPRFCSEFGVQSPSTRETLAEAGLLQPPEPATMLPPSLLARQRGPGGMARWYDEPLAKLFPPAQSFDTWLAQAHEMQARHLYTAIVWLRANSDACSGALIWQLNDAWPGLSWSLIDSAGREKPAYFAVQRAFAPRLIEVIPFSNQPHLVVINDTDEPWAGSHAIDGRTVAFNVGRRSVGRIPLLGAASR